uniref:Putative secreted protein n=1 Tax=Anopheles darlingi TaxID=43151 RepID=A0A2M4DD97_ANODA
MVAALVMMAIHVWYWILHVRVCVCVCASLASTSSCANSCASSSVALTPPTNQSVTVVLVIGSISVDREKSVALVCLLTTRGMYAPRIFHVSPFSRPVSSRCRGDATMTEFRSKFRHR